MTDRISNLLFPCIGNSARSILAGATAVEHRPKEIGRRREDG